MKKDNQFVNGILFTLQIAGSAFFIWSIFQTTFLPVLYKALIGGAIVVFALFSTFLMLKKKGKISTKWIRYTYVFLISLTVSSVGIFLPLFDTRMKQVLEPPNSGQLLIDVITLNDKTFTDKKDLLNGKVAIQTAVDLENQEYAITFINSDIQGTLDVVEYGDFEEAMTALYSHEVDYLIINETYINIIGENYEQFENIEEEVKVVYQVKRIIAFDNVASDANVTEKAFNILIIGQNQKSAKISDRTNTDVVMLMTINPNTKQILLTSFPRDTYLSVPYSGMKDKLTHAGIYGAEMTVKTIQNYMGIKIDFYIRVNYSALINMVEAVGGISVDNPSTFKAVYPKYKYTFKEGPLDLNGDEALAYVRERKQVKCGDMGRNEHQRIVLDGLVRKASSPSMLINFNRLMQAVEENYLTNLSTDQIYSIVKMQLNDLAHWEILSQGLSGPTGREFCASMYSYKKPPEENRKLSIVHVNSADLKKAKENIQELTSNKKLTKEDVKLPTYDKNC